MSAISVVQGLARTRTGLFINPEDARTFGAQTAAEEAPTVKRAARAWHNDLENIPIFLILGWIYVTAGLSATTFFIYCAIFVVARIVHTICYLNGIQPLRTIAFTLGALTTFAMVVQLLIKVVVA
ncbi:MAG: MAPEG family protein [Deltaproteobacteria bacterium]|nr:MAPEG family protein [Deltaproteobacteria bacterium]